MGNVKTGNPGMACVKEFKTCIGKCISRIPESKQVFDGIVVLLDKTGYIEVSHVVFKFKHLFKPDFGIPAAFGFKVGIIKNRETAG